MLQENTSLELSMALGYYSEEGRARGCFNVLLHDILYITGGGTDLVKQQSPPNGARQWSYEETRNQSPNS